MTEIARKKFEWRVADGAIALLLVLLAFLGGELWEADDDHDREMVNLREVVADIKNTDTLIRTEQLNVLRRLEFIDQALRTRTTDRYYGKDAALDRANTASKFKEVHADLKDHEKRIDKLEREHSRYEKELRKKLPMVMAK